MVLFVDVTESIAFVSFFFCPNFVWTNLEMDDHMRMTSVTSIE